MACHGLSWKRLYIERHLQSLLEAYYPSKSGANYDRMRKEMSAGKAFVHSLNIQQLLSHLDLSEVLLKFNHLNALSLRYGARRLGMDYDKSLFGMQLRDAMSLSNYIRKTISLSRLTLRENLLNDESIQILSEALSENQTITALDLSYNRIGNAGAKRLSKVMMEQPVLTHLDLSDNNIQSEGAEKLGLALKHTDSLLSFNVKLNPLGDVGGSEILQGVVDHPTLTSLDISAADLGPEAGSSLLHLLESNTNLTSLNIACNELRMQGEDLQAALGNSPSIVELDFRRCEIEQEPTEAIKKILFKRSADLKQARRKEYQKGWDEAL